MNYLTQKTVGSVSKDRKDCAYIKNEILRRDMLFCRMSKDNLKRTKYIKNCSEKYKVLNGIVDIPLSQEKENISQGMKTTPKKCKKCCGIVQLKASVLIREVPWFGYIENFSNMDYVSQFLNSKYGLKYCICVKIIRRLNRNNLLDGVIYKNILYIMRMSRKAYIIKLYIVWSKQNIFPKDIMLLIKSYF
jgi:hypothetical protein